MSETSSQRRTLGEENRRRKENMCFNKNDYLIRFSDLEEEAADFIWKVDNHQLLIKYIRIGDAGTRKVYMKTKRYTGWYCDEPWDYFELKGRVKEDGQQILVDYPTPMMLQEIRDEKTRQLEKDAPEDNDDCISV